MKEKILKLRKDGKTYNEIRKIIGCSKGTISYHCGVGQKEKSKERVRKRRENLIIDKLDKYKNRKMKNKKEQVRQFNKGIYDGYKTSKRNRIVDKNKEMTFTWEDILKKYTENTKCYLSGVDINLYENNYSFDHIIPISKNGNNTFNNLGILHRNVNMMKTDMSVDELLKWCKLILEYNGYDVNINN